MTARGPAPSFVFGPQLTGGLDRTVASVVREQAADALAAWCDHVGDPSVAAAIERFVDGGAIDLPSLQSAVTAVQVALAVALTRRGLEPAAVAGLSMGELAAAVVSGSLDLAAGARVASGVAALFRARGLDGAMVAVASRRDALARALPCGATLAVTLAPTMQVIAGRDHDLGCASSALRASGVAIHPLHLPGAFHTSAIDPQRADFLAAVGHIEPRPARAPLYSGIERAAPRLDERYWWRVCRERFHFDDTIRAMLADGVRWFVEIGVRPAIGVHIAAIAAELAVTVRIDSAPALLVPR